jgi:predicted dehydrogenase
MTVHGGPRAAIIGAGLMGRWHADAVRRIGGRVTVIVDPDASAREALGRRYPEARLAADFDADFVAQHATAAHVCTPLPTHVPIVAALIDAGVHALVEKPFSETAETTAELTSRAHSRGVMVCPVHQFLFQYGIRQLALWLPEMGTVRRFEFSTCSAGAATNDAASLDALIGEILPHPLSLVQLVLRSNVASATWQIAHPTPGEFRALSTIGEAIVDVAISAHGRPTENTLRVIADGGSASADLFHGFAVRQSADVSRRRKIVAPFVSSGKTLRGASVNLLRRAVRREPAYPGLRELVVAFYSKTEIGGPWLISPDAIVDVAAARDHLVPRLRVSRT